MSKRKENSKNVCDKCGSKIKYFQCSACGGSGYYREWIFFKRDCGLCSGTGKVLRCPNEFKHIIEDLKLSRTLSTNSLYRNFRTNAPRRTTLGQTNLLPDTSFSRTQIPPPWHASYPNPWHPFHPNNPRNQPFNPVNPNSPNNPNNINNPNNPMNPMNRHNPFNPNNPNNPMK